MAYCKRDKEMKILNVSRTDWAGFSYDNAMALRSVGVDAESLCMIAHSFNYANCSTPATRETIIRKMKEADVVQIMHSCSFSLNYYIISGTKAKLIVYHTGSIYRNDPVIFNKLFHNAHIHMTDQCEFMLIGDNKNKFKYIATAVNTDIIKRSTKTLSNPISFGHYPSNPAVKGSDTILKVIGDIKNQIEYRDRFSFMFSSDIVNHDKQLERMNDCDVYIELFKPILDGKKYGCYGVTAFEAAAMGKIVITQNIYEQIYNETYGLKSEFIIANTEEELSIAIRGLGELSPKLIMELQDKTYQWLVDNHSYKSTGTRLINILCNQ